MATTSGSRSWASDVESDETKSASAGKRSKDKKWGKSKKTDSEMSGSDRRRGRREWRPKRKQDAKLLDQLADLTSRLEKVEGSAEEETETPFNPLTDNGIHRDEEEEQLEIHKRIYFKFTTGGWRQFAANMVKSVAAGAAVGLGLAGSRIASAVLGKAVPSLAVGASAMAFSINTASIITTQSVKHAITFRNVQYLSAIWGFRDLIASPFVAASSNISRNVMSSFSWPSVIGPACAGAVVAAVGLACFGVAEAKCTNKSTVGIPITHTYMYKSMGARLAGEPDDDWISGRSDGDNRVDRHKQAEMDKLPGIFKMRYQSYVFNRYNKRDILTVSLPLMAQLMDFHVADIHESPESVSLRMRHAAASVSSINLDRNLPICSANVVSDTVLAAYGLFMAEREKRDIIPF